MSDSRSLTIYDRVDNPIAFCQEMGKSFAALIDCAVDQGPAIALACLCDNLNPMQFQRTYHMIQGRPSMRADAMLAAFRKLGGKHEVLRRDPDGASVKLTIDDEEYTSTLTWEEAQQEDFVWARDKGKWVVDKEGNRVVKDNYAYPRKRMQMLWARVISDGVRAMRPEITAGIYTPEETSDFIEGEFTVRPTADEPAKPDAKAAALQLAERKKAEAEAAKHDSQDPPFDPDDKGEVIDADFQPAGEQPAAAAEDQKTLGEGYCTSAQSQRIHDLYAELGISHESQQNALKKRGAQAVRNLTQQDAQEIIDRLEYLKANGPKQLAEAKN